MAVRLPVQETIITMLTDNKLRLFQLISPSLPTGSFTYSQGLEWAVEQGWVHDRQSLVKWLSSLLFTCYRELEIPLLQRLYTACANQDVDQFNSWCEFTLASRETKELREEEKTRGRAMVKLIQEFEPELHKGWLEPAASCQLAGFALLSQLWQIELEEAALGYIWSWLENMVMAAIKIVPLGQTTGQLALVNLNNEALQAVEAGLIMTDEQLGGSCPYLALSSSLHETQYTRLFRS